MPLHDGPALTPADLQAGDIVIVYEDEPDHSLIWVGGNKPLVHCADSETTSGIVQQSNYLFGDGEPFAEVYRSNNGALAASAVLIAERFAMRSDDPVYVQAKRDGAHINLRTRFSQHRLGGNGGVWGPEALVRAVRAYYRAFATRILSANEGVTCSQFLTYTYQAAGVRAYVEPNQAATTLVNDLANEGLLGNLHLHGLSPMEGMCNVGRTYTRLRTISEQVLANIPAAMRVNACIMAVDVLAARLHAGGGFAHVGNLGGMDDEDD